MVLLSKPVATIAALLPVLTGVFASPLSEPAKLEERQSGFFVVTGVTGGVSPRLELSVLQSTAPTQFGLFILALTRFEAMSQTDKLSYYQLSGIHGAPYVTWDGVGPTANSRTGYCFHSSNIFGTWHRPYLAAFEQALVIKANEIVNEMPAGTRKDEWAAAALTLRLPYLDWARPLAATAPVMPTSLTDFNIAVRHPDGFTRTIKNPLYEYNFNPRAPADFGSPWSSWTRTVRRPASNTNTNSPNNNAGVNTNLKSMQTYIRQYVYTILSQYQSFNEFSNTGSEQSILGTLEGIHDTIHSTVSGHMGIVSIAAFDPLFWLHHCNIDRIMALFQGVYPDTYVTPFAQRRSTYTSAQNAIQDVNSPLRPFHSSSAGAFWTSAQVRSTTALGYTYPELADSPSNATLISRINALYRPGVTTLTARDLSENESLERRAPTPRVYLANIEAPAAISGGTYEITVFFGSPTTEAIDYKLDPGFVGVQGLLAKPGAATDQIVTGSIPLTAALDERKRSGALRADSHRAVLRYLTNNLKWRVSRDGVEISNDQVPNLKVTVNSAPVIPAKSSSEFPTWGDFKEHPEVTEGKNGMKF